jgi:CRP-like cAMP-binding protein
MNYYIPIKLMKKEFLYNQQNFSDSFYIIQEGTFDAYCEISLSEFSKYKNYIIKNNKNIFDLINNEKEKNKLTIDKIIEHMNKMQEINIYPKDKKEIDKNMEYIKKKMLEQGEENDTKIINIKLNEDILSEKKRKIRIKLFTLKKNDIIGFIDSLELKNRFYTVECVSDIGELSKIRILDFIVFIKSNNGIDINKIYEYIQEKKNFVVDRVYKTLDRYLNNNKRIIRNLYSLAFSSIDKKSKKL